ncbi:MAG TPA: monovalent cation/H+ antiporter complex subunit F [Mycobacteriales bacterium]|nr:monovalent cation/H+ antiporter complex subunit F [Mycobacteriales bacterium]
MTALYAVVAIAETALIGLAMVRLALGPTVSDRIVALNTAAAQAALGLLFFAAYADRSIYLDVGIWLASFTYLGTLIWARLLERGML